MSSARMSSAAMSSAPQVHGVEVVGRAAGEETAVSRQVPRAGSAADGARS